jgi:hypothetical protein
LGHILFHITDDSYLVSRLASTNPFEKEAYQFANMLLLPEKQFNRVYAKEWTYKDLPWMYILTAYLAYRQDIVSLSRFSQLLFIDIREARQIIKKLDEILENSADTEH